MWQFKIFTKNFYKKFEQMKMFQILLYALSNLFDSNNSTVDWFNQNILGLTTGLLSLKDLYLIGLI